jgi:hypothetical protein
MSTAARSTAPSPTVEPVSGSDVLLDALSEREFQASVVEALKSRGWVVFSVPDMRRTTAGLPDLIFYHPNVPGLLLCWELKRSDGRPTRKQRARLAHLGTVPGVDARLVRPRTWPALRDVIDDTSRSPIVGLAAIPKEVLR